MTKIWCTNVQNRTEDSEKRGDSFAWMFFLPLQLVGFEDVHLCRGFRNVDASCLKHKTMSYFAKTAMLFKGTAGAQGAAVRLGPPR